MNGGVTYRDMEERRVAIVRAERTEVEVARLRDLLIQAGQVISALNPSRPTGGILDRIEKAVAKP